MVKRDEIVLVFGATGNQGGAVARHLLAEGWRVRGVSRNPDRAEAKALKQQGAEIVDADMEDRAALERIMSGVYGVFSVQNFWTSGFDAEIRQGKNVVNAAAKLPVKHFVYTSVGGAERNSGLPHFESKWQIEQHIQKLDLPATVYRPVFFIDNFHGTAWGFGDHIREGKLLMGLKPSTKLQMIAVDDVGTFVAKAFANPAEFKGKSYELAGDELTMKEIAAQFSKYQPKPVEHVQVPIEQVRSTNKEWADMLEWFDAEGYKADIPALRKIHPGLMTFEDWLKKNWK
ncbi:NmrA/HSCARG family protein [bacterium]|nr:NmrA/HSCARG family protein [bacterium]MCI0602628.1 NmrA/HSCARG family protein [bacterium]